MLCSTIAHRVACIKSLQSVCCGLKIPQRHDSTSGKNDWDFRERAIAAYKNRLNLISERFNQANEKYEQFVGLSDVQEAQKKVKKAEAVFLDARSRERAILRDMTCTREKLKHVRERLSHVDYSNPMYLQLATEQHELVTQEDKQKRELEEAEENERDSFSSLSYAMRESYEQERARVERTKNWSIIGTMVGTIIGMVGSIYMNRVRTKELIQTVKETSEKTDVSSKIETMASATEEKQSAIASAINTLSEHVSNMSNALQVQNMEVLSGFVNDPYKSSLPLQGSPKQQAANTDNNHNHAMLQALNEEIDQYNNALLSLSNAVASLANTGTVSSKRDHNGIDECLDKVLENVSETNSKLDDIIASANKINVKGILNRLRSIEERLEPSAPGAISTPSADITELDDLTDTTPRWQTGLKDFAIWGSVLYCVYLIISV